MNKLTKGPTYQQPHWQIDRNVMHKREKIQIDKNTSRGVLHTDAWTERSRQTDRQTDTDRQTQADRH